LTAALPGTTVTVVLALQYDTPLPPAGKQFPVDLLTSAVVGQTSVAAVAPTPYYDTSLPPVRARASSDLLTSIQSGQQGLPRAGPIVADLPLVGRLLSADQRTWIIAGQQGPAQGAQFSELPPLGRGPAFDILTSYQFGSTISIIPPTAPFYQTDTSLPPVSLRLAIDDMTSYNFGSIPIPPTGPPPLHAQKFRGDVGSLMTH